MQTSLRRIGACPTLSRFLYPSRCHLRSPACLLYRRPSHVPLEGFSSQKHEAADDPAPGGVPTALSSPPAPAWLRSYSQLWLSGQPSARSPITTLCTVIGLCTRIAPRYDTDSKCCRCFGCLDMPRLRRGDARDGKAYCRPDSTPLSASSTEGCRMKAQFRSRIILVFRHQPAICVSWASSQVVLLAAGVLHRTFPLRKRDPILDQLGCFPLRNRFATPCISPQSH